MNARRTARGRIRRALAMVAASTAVLAGCGIALAPAPAFAAPAAADTCRGVSTVGLYCGHHTGTKSARLGSGGAHVKEIQALINETSAYLAARGERLDVDGRFGPATKAAVAWFQWTYIGAAASDGIVGPHTWEELRYGSR